MSVTRVIRDIVPEVELIGDWDKVGELLGGLDEAIKIGTDKGQQSAAKKLLTIVKRNIRDNGGSLGWEPVSAKYALWKTDMGYDPNKLLRLSNTYYKNIIIWNARGRYYVGVKANLRNPISKGDITVGEIANILERGREKTKMPARPLWGPSFRKHFGGTARVKNLIIWHIRNEIRNRLGVKAKIT